MAASSVSSPSSTTPSSQFIFRPPSPSLSITPTRFQLKTSPLPRFHLQASRRPPNFRQDGDTSAVDPRNRTRNMSFIGDYDDDDDDDEDEEEEDDESDRSLDLLIQFVENVYKKISKRARKAVRSVLPINIPTKLVGFSVNGVLILAFLWILRAFLEVICTLGSVVFVSILLVRGVWTGISYFQEGPNRRTWSDFNDENDAWTGTRPAT